MYISDLIEEQIKQTVKKLYDIDLSSVLIEHPQNEDFGDYSTNVALTLSKKLNKPPVKIAEEICYELLNLDPKFNFEGENYSLFSKIYSIDPGFINLHISTVWLDLLLYFELEFSKVETLYDKHTIMVEYTDLNPFKIFHIGHLMSNCIGEAISQILEHNGAQVKRANYQGDVGLHVAKSIWGMRERLSKENMKLDDVEKLSVGERIAFLGACYAMGAQAYESDPNSVEVIKDINYLVYISAQNRLKKEENWTSQIDYTKYLTHSPTISLKEVSELYVKGRSWSLEYFETVYKRLGTKFDFYYFESVVGEYGYPLVQELLKKGILEESDGAVVFKGEKYGLHTRVFVNSYGLPTYETKELGLAVKKYEDAKYDLSINVTANEIAEYFKVLLKVMELCRPDLASKTRHLAHGMMKLPTGKMSSRTGKVLSGDELLNKVKEAVLEMMTKESYVSVVDDKNEVGDKIAVAALKYSILKQNIGSDIVYDAEKSLALHGDTGPYLLYTYARANSVLTKAGKMPENIDGQSLSSYTPNTAELSIVRYLPRFNESVLEAAKKLSPNLVADYLHELAQRFNTFYASQPILDASAGERKFRLLLTAKVADTLKTGLHVLGIKVVERM